MVVDKKENVTADALKTKITNLPKDLKKVEILSEALDVEQQQTGRLRLTFADDSTKEVSVPFVINKGKKNEVDKSSLKAMIAEAEALIESDDFCMLDDSLTKTVITHLDNAKTIDKKESASKKEVDEAEQNLSISMAEAKDGIQDIQNMKAEINIDGSKNEVDKKEIKNQVLSAVRKQLKVWIEPGDKDICVLELENELKIDTSKSGKTDVVVVVKKTIPAKEGQKERVFTKNVTVTVNYTAKEKKENK